MKFSFGQKQSIIQFLPWVVVPAVIVLLLYFFVFQAFNVTGSSMSPNLQDGNYVVVSKFGVTAAKVGRVFNKNVTYIPGRGDIVVFENSFDPDKLHVKRVVGLPGDRVVIKYGNVKVFNKANPDGFNPDAGYEPQHTITLIDTDETVKQGHVFVLGDNRADGGSLDSRKFGQLPSENIIGTAIFRLLPIGQSKTI